MKVLKRTGWMREMMERKDKRDSGFCNLYYDLHKDDVLTLFFFEEKPGLFELSFSGNKDKNMISLFHEIIASCELKDRKNFYIKEYSSKEEMNSIIDRAIDKINKLQAFI